MKFWIRRSQTERGWFARLEETYHLPPSTEGLQSVYNYRQAVPMEELPEFVRMRLAALIVSGPQTELPGVGAAFSDYFFIDDPEGDGYLDQGENHVK